MNEEDFEGTLVLEKLSEIGKVDEFYEAVDSDDFDRVKGLMRLARLDSDMIRTVLKKMSEGDAEP
jgi:hypothetical protein